MHGAVFSATGAVLAVAVGTTIKCYDVARLYETNLSIRLCQGFTACPVGCFRWAVREARF